VAIGLSDPEYTRVCADAAVAGLRPTTYATALVLSGLAKMDILATPSASGVKALRAHARTFNRLVHGLNVRAAEAPQVVITPRDARDASSELERLAKAVAALRDELRGGLPGGLAVGTSVGGGEPPTATGSTSHPPELTPSTSSPGEASSS